MGRFKVVNHRGQLGNLHSELVDPLWSLHADISVLVNCFFLAELQRAKRANEAPWVRKIGNPSSRENLVTTSAYDRASAGSERTSVQTRGEGDGRLEIFLTVTHAGN